MRDPLYEKELRQTVRWYFVGAVALSLCAILMVFVDREGVAIVLTVCTLIALGAFVEARHRLTKEELRHGPRR